MEGVVGETQANEASRESPEKDEIMMPSESLKKNEVMVPLGLLESRPVKKFLAEGKS